MNFTVTFGCQNFPKLNSRPVYWLRLYGTCVLGFRRTFNTMQISNLILIISLTFKGLTPILGSAAASCTRRQSCTEDEDEANTDDQMTEDSHADDLTVPPPPSPPCTCGKNLELPPTPPLDDLEAAAKNLTYSQQGRTIFLLFTALFSPLKTLICILSSSFGQNQSCRD